MMPSPSLSLADYTPAQKAALSLSGTSAFYMSGEDALQISGWNITSSARLRASVRFLGLDGRVQSAEHDLPLTTDRVITSLLRQLGEGWLLGLTIRVVGATSPYGATYARAQIVRGLDASAIVLGTLCAGCVTSAQPIAFPNGRVLPTLGGRGNLRSITGTDPAANTEISETVPTGAYWVLHGIYAVLTTDATVANRIPVLIVDDGTNIILRAGPLAVQAASNSTPYSGGGFGFQGTLNAVNAWSLPAVPLRLGPGYRVRTATTAIQAGDNYAAPQLLVEEYFEAA